LKASRAQTGKPIGFEGALPGEELLLRELVATAGFLDSDLAGAHCGHDRRFSYPRLEVRSGWIPPIRSDEPTAG
jgi:hypothetical protein